MSELSLRAPRRRRWRLERIIDEVIALSARRTEGVLLGEIEETLRNRGAGVLVLVLSMPFVVPVPIPLLATACGIPMMILGVRMALFRDSSLPAFARRTQLSAPALRAVSKGLATLVRPLARLFRPRLRALSQPASTRLIGLSICLAAFVLSLPIPIPFANLIPAVALIHLAAGLLQRDGLAVCVGHALTVGAYVYLYLIWDTAVGVLQNWF